MQPKNELKAGIFIVVGLALFAITIFVMGGERQIFADQDEFFVTFKDVKGLSEGAPVRLGGITVGRVSKIGFSSNQSDPTVHVALLINHRYLDRLPIDSVVTLETQGLLGDRFLGILPGRDKTMIKPGSILKSHEASDMAQIITKAEEIVDNTKKASQQLAAFLERFNTEGAEGFTKTMKGIAEMVEQAQKGKGLMHSLFYDPAGAETLAALRKAAENFAVTSGQISALAEEIKNGDGILHDVIYKKSSGGLDEVVAKLHATADNLRKASEALAQGNGTIGALLIDPQVYDNLVEITDGAKRSFILRQAIKSSMQK